MSKHYHDELKRLQNYAERKRLKLLEQLGSGVDGLVWSTNRGSAVKAHRSKDLFEKELRVYFRLDEHSDADFCGFNVPKMIEFHPELFVIEMHLVVPPFVVDFVGATLDRPSPALSAMEEEELVEWENDKLELFGAPDWEIVSNVISRFRRIGIHLNDVHKGNIRLRNETEDV